MIFGFPEMDIVEGTRRSYPPHLILFVSESIKGKVLLEEGYGKDIGFKPSDYQHPNVYFKNKQDVYSISDYIICITAPSKREMNMMREGQTLLAFLHYNTHAVRNKWFYDRNIQTISLDELVDSDNQRIVEDLRSTSFNAVKVAFIALKQSWGDDKWFSKNREHIKAIVMGFGEIGKHATKALNKFDYTGLRDKLIKTGNPRITVTVLGRKETENETFMNHLLPNADILVDATYRPEGKNHLPIINKEQLELLPQDSVICDITADRYDISKEPHIVKAIEGIPTGKDSDYKMPIFSKNHTAFTNESYVPKMYQLTPKQRRMVVSSYSWPSFGTPNDRLKNVEIYTKQIKPFLGFLIENGVEGIKQPVSSKSSTLNDILYNSLNPLNKE